MCFNAFMRTCLQIFKGVTPLVPEKFAKNCVFAPWGGCSMHDENNKKCSWELSQDQNTPQPGHFIDLLTHECTHRHFEKCWLCFGCVGVLYVFAVTWVRVIDLLGQNRRKSSPRLSAGSVPTWKQNSRLVQVCGFEHTQKFWEQSVAYSKN